MKPALLLQNAIVPALKLLPSSMDSPQAVAMLIAIAAQESRIEHRAQIGGPARGYWQFELGGGVRGVLTHPSSKPHIQSALAALDYDADSPAITCYGIIQHNDILAAAFARLLLWTLPDPLPDHGEPTEGWDQYIAAWRPGKPHRSTWAAHFATAWGVLT